MIKNDWGISTFPLVPGYVYVRTDLELYQYLFLSVAWGLQRALAFA